MALLEQEIVQIKKDIREGSASHRKSKHQHSQRLRLWSDLFSSLYVLCLSFGVLSLAAFEKNIGGSVSAAADQFKWMVLVRGDSLQIDEVGRFLRQLPGAKEVALITSEEAFAKLQADPMYFNDLSSFKAEDLPTSWKVSWESNPLDFSLIELWAEDVRRLPSVLGVAFDPNTVLLIKGLRSAWYKVRMALSLIALATALFGVLLLGRYLFFTPFSSVDWKKFAVCIVRDQIFWAIGGGIVFRSLGGFLWPFWLGGLLIGALHAVWNSIEQFT